MGHWVSQWLIDSFRCDAIAYPSFANLFWHIESAQNCQNWGPIPPQSIQNLFRQNSCFLVGSKFLTSFEAPEFLGRIRTDLLPSADFLSFCSFPFGMQQTFEWFRKSLNLHESRRKLQPSFLLGFKDSRWVFWTTQEFSEGFSEQQKYFLSNKIILWGFSEQQKNFLRVFWATEVFSVNWASLTSVSEAEGGERSLAPGLVVDREKVGTGNLPENKNVWDLFVYCMSCVDDVCSIYLK